MKLNDVEIEQAELVKQLEAQGLSVTIRRTGPTPRDAATIEFNSGLDVRPGETCDNVELRIAYDQIGIGPNYGVDKSTGYWGYSERRFNMLMEDLEQVRREMGW